VPAMKLTTMQVAWQSMELPGLPPGSVGGSQAVMPVPSTRAVGGSGRQLS